MTPYQRRRFDLLDKCGYFYKTRTIRAHLWNRLAIRPFTAILALI